MFKVPLAIAFRVTVVRIVQIPAGVALVLCIVGATSTNSAADITNQDTIKAAVLLYTVVFVMIILLVSGATVLLHGTERRGERSLLYFTAASLPFLMLRLVHSLLLIFDSKLKTSIAGSPVHSRLVQLFMADIEEMVIVLLFVWAGLKQPVVPKESGKAHTGASGIAYRVGRGDFGGGNLAMAIAIAAGIADFKRDPEKNKSSQWLPKDVESATGTQ